MLLHLNLQKGSTYKIRTIYVINHFRTDCINIKQQLKTDIV